MRDIRKLTTWERYEKRLLKDKKFKEVADRLEPEYQLVKSLIELRLRKKMTQKDLADKIGTKQPVISRLETMSSKPSFSLLEKISIALDARLHVFFR